MSAKRWQRILVVVASPFAPEQLAAAKAAAVARRCGARVVLFNTFMVPQPISDVPMDSREQIIGAAIRQREQRLAQIAAQLRLPTTTKCIVRWDYPTYEAIVRQVRNQTGSAHHGVASPYQARPYPAREYRLGAHARVPVSLVVRALAGVAEAAARAGRGGPAPYAREADQLDDRLLQTARTVTGQLGGRIAIVHSLL